MNATVWLAHYGEERELNLSDEEKELACIAIQALTDAGVSSISLVRKSNSYATIVTYEPYEFDLIRFKMSPRAKWASVPISNEDAKTCRDSPLFAAQKNKNQIHWKAKLATPTDVLQLIPYAVSSLAEVLGVEKEVIYHQ